jgi:glycerol-3-phosphate dehydrogenase (NAD(P)+)
MIGVLGSGAWGTALALLAHQAGNAVLLWARDPEQAALLRSRRENRHHLPGIRLPPELEVTSSLPDLRACEPLLVVVPAQAVRTVLAALEPGERTLVICAKGLERGSGRRLSEVALEVAPVARPAVLSGPSFALEAARGVPTAVTLAAGELDVARSLAARLATPGFRPYPSDDVVGVEIGGALKNVVAIAAGIAMGRGFGENARAALLTRGLAELARLGQALGARPQTLTGLSGLGDLVLSATSLTSRNTRFGFELGRGRSLAELTAPGAALAEGSWTAQAALELGRAAGVELPICQAVAAVLGGQASVDDAIEALLSRPLPERE